jgi:hypothetical protein
MKQIHFARKKRQLNVLIYKFQRLLDYHQKEAKTQIKKLALKIRKLIRELLTVISPADVKKILGATVLFVGVSSLGQLKAQDFAPPISNPFGLDSVQYGYPTFVDIDGDNDMDLFVGTDILRYFENIGSHTDPQFSSPLVNPFGLDSISSLAIPDFVDLDNDGDFDLLIVTTPGVAKYFENTGTALDPQFANPLVDPFGIHSTHRQHSFADIDGDGDFDLFAGAGYSDPGCVFYYENIGTPKNPQFANPLLDPFGIIAVDDINNPAFADIDADGDIDWISGLFYSTVMVYYENTGSITNPQFENHHFEVGLNYNSISPAFADLDGDGDNDLLVREDDGVLQYYENKTPSAVSNINQTIALELFPNPVDDILIIETREKIKKIEILDLLGEKVLSIKSNFNQISLNNLQPGIYSIKITLMDNINIVRKILKK